MQTMGTAQHTYLPKSRSGAAAAANSGFSPLTQTSPQVHSCPTPGAIISYGTGALGSCSTQQLQIACGGKILTPVTQVAFTINKLQNNSITMVMTTAFYNIVLALTTRPHLSIQSIVNC